MFTNGLWGDGAEVRPLFDENNHSTVHPKTIAFRKKHFRIFFEPYIVEEICSMWLKRGNCGNFHTNLRKGVYISNLKNMRQFYFAFPNGDALRCQLS
jgi:hypothetical protein